MRARTDLERFTQRPGRVNHLLGSRWTRPVLVVAIVVLTQAAILDRVALFGFLHVPLTVYLAVVVGLRFEPSDAALLGFGVGMSSDLLQVSHLGRQAIVLCLVAWLVSAVAPRLLVATLPVGLIERAAIVLASLLATWTLGALLGFALPLLTWHVLASLVVGTLLGGVVTRPHAALWRAFGESAARVPERVVTARHQTLTRVELR